jgi:hypothetical protein
MLFLVAKVSLFYSRVMATAFCGINRRREVQK